MFTLLFLSICSFQRTRRDLHGALADPESSLKIKQNQVYFQSMWNFLSGFRLELVPCPKVLPSGRLPRKEVIQPQVLLRLPCYDFTPIIDPTFGRWLHYWLPHGLRVLPTLMV